MDLGLEFDGVRLEPLEVPLVVGGIGDGRITVIVQPIGEQVVEHAAVLTAETRVLVPPTWIFETSLESRRWKQLRRPRPLGLDLAHVGDVEDTAFAADPEVLVADPVVLNGHLPSRRRDQLRPGHDMCFIQGALASRLPPAGP